MKKVIYAVALLAGCATPLGYVNPQPNKTQAEQDAAMAYCIHLAEMAQESPNRVITSGLLSATIIGAPYARKLRQDEMREVFAGCMKERGFTVTPPQ